MPFTIRLVLTFQLELTSDPPTNLDEKKVNVSIKFKNINIIKPALAMVSILSLFKLVRIGNPIPIASKPDNLPNFDVVKMQ